MMQWVLTPSGGETEFTTSFGHSDQSYRIAVANGPTVPHFADSGPDVTSPNAINDGNWHMLVGVYDGINQHLYVDGIAQGGESASEPAGRQIDVWIGGAPDYGTGRLFTGSISQCAIFTNALSAAQVKALYDAAELAPIDLSITPASPSVYVGRNVTLSAAATLGSPITSYQWYVINSGVSNIIAGATSAAYTLTDATTAENGETIGVIAGNVAGSLTASVSLSVNDAAASLGTDIMPTNAEAVIGTSVTYTVTAAGSLPIAYQWTMDGSAVSGATDSIFTFNAASGAHLIQVGFTNALSAGVHVLSSVASLTGLASIAPITFNSLGTNGTGWVTNSISNPGSTVPYFTNDTLEVTDGSGPEGANAFYPIAQYVGSFTAAFVYTVHTFSIPTGDGVTFMLQDSGAATNAVGGTEGGLGFSGITNSLALEMDIYGNGAGNGSVGLGINAETNGVTFADGGGPLYGSTGDIALDSGDPIQFNLGWANGILTVDIEDLTTSAKYSTNYNLGPIVPILGANLAYVGLSGADGDANSDQWFSDFVFQPGVAAPPGVTLTVSKPSGGSIELSWPTSATGFAVYQAASLSGPWTANTAPVVVVGANNTVTITTGPGAEFYRLEKP